MEIRDDRRKLLVTAALISATGAVVMLAIIWSGFSDNMQESLAMILFAAIGAAVAGLATHRLFGRAAALGWVLAALGATLATALGAALGGPLFFTAGVALFGLQGAAPLSDIPQIALLTVMVVFSMLASLKVGPPWFVGMVLVHVIARRLRAAA